MTNRNRNGRFAKNGKNPRKANATSFKKGQSGNPSGRPAHKQMTETLKAELAKDNVTVDIIKKVVMLVKAGERWAVELIFDRIDGKRVSRVDIRARLVERAKAAGIDPDEAIAAADAIIKERDW